MAAIVENEAFTSDVVSADLKAKLNGKWCICHQEGLDAFYRDARHLGWLQRKVLCVTTGVSVEFEFGADNTCKFTMTFSLKSATGDFTLGTPIKDDEHNVTTLLRARGDTIIFSKTFGENDTVDDLFTLEGDGDDLVLVCNKQHTSGAKALRKFKKSA